LPLDHRFLRLIVRERSSAGLVGECESEVVHRYRVVLDVFGTYGRPRAHEFELRGRLACCKNGEKQRDSRASGYQLDEHGVGSHLEPSGSFLKCGLTMYGPVRYTGSSTTVVTSRSLPPSGSGATSKGSVTVVLSLYGTPFFRR